jgi:sec-independent protein translocase protein TatC
MSTLQLPYIVALIVILLLVPMVVLVLVRIFIPLEEAVEASPEIMAEQVPGFETLSEFWQSMIPHLIELRDRLIKAFLALGITTAIGFWIVNSDLLFGMKLPDFLVTHLAPDITLQGIGVGEVFISYMRIALVVGVALAMPVIIYQLVAFFSPALLPAEKRMVYTALPFVTELFLAGLAFGWFFTVPAALQFLLGYGQTALIKTQPTVDSFMGTVATLLMVNGLVFQLPAVIYLLARLGVVNTKMLSQTRRYAIVVITVIAAFITPTGDPFNLMLLAVPMYLLYELGILLTRFVPKKPEEGGLPAGA